MKTETKRRCLSSRRVADMLDMSVQWVREQVLRGDLPGYRLGSQVMVDADGLEGFLRNRRLN